MAPRPLALLALATLVVTGGCAATTGPASPTPETAEPTDSPTRATTTAPAPLDSLPPAACRTDAVPQPDAVDGVEPSSYPAPPTRVDRDAVVNWTQAFETAYVRNRQLVEASDDDNMTLTRASAYAEVRAVNRTPDGYVLRFSDSAARNYASGIHGDWWADVGYVVTADRVVRVALGGQDDPVEASDGTVVVGCG